MKDKQMTVGMTISVQGMTCRTCVSHVQRALRAAPGVHAAEVDLATGSARVTFDPTLVAPERLLGAISATGYGAQLATEAERAVTSRERFYSSWLRPAVVAVLGAAGLMFLYLSIVSLAESPAHALQQLRQDLGFVVPIMAGFGIQAGLYAHLRWNVLARPSAALPASGGTTSTAAMIACCAHHLVDVLPFLGLSAAAVFLNEYRQWFLLAGVVMNLIGIVVMLLTIRKVRAGTCLPAGA